MEELNIDILERIHAAYFQLTAAERRVADYVFAQHEQVQLMSITQLAEECGTAEATVSRFCRSLQLKGFNAFKIELAHHCVSAVQTPHAKPADAVVAQSLETGQLAIDAVQGTVELVNPKLIRKAVQIIEKSAHVHCMGTGGSMIMAHECSYMFSTVSGKFFAIYDSHIQMSTAATMDQHDAIILFSYSGATHNCLRILELAKSRSVRTILVTRFHNSPAAKLADVVLCCGSNEGPYQFGSVPAKIAQLVVIDFLFQEYCHRNWQACEANRLQIGDALAQMHI
jgi:DNA-binding MurR/RpiR family transcriptional regulator